MNTNTNPVKKAESFDIVKAFKELLAGKINDVIKKLPKGAQVCTIQCMTAGSTQREADAYNKCAHLIRETMSLDTEDVYLVSQGDRQIPKSSDECPEPRASGVAAATAQLGKFLQEEGHKVQILGVTEDKSNEDLQRIYPYLDLAEESSDVRKILGNIVPILKGPDGAAILRQYYPEIDLYIDARKKQDRKSNLHYFLQQLFAAKLAEATGGYQILIDPNQAPLRTDKHISAHYLDPSTCPTVRIKLPDIPPQ